MKSYLALRLTPLEWGLWITSLLVVTGAFLLSGTAEGLTLAASLVGVTALLFVGKGHPLGQGLTIVFAALYGIISSRVRYWGEVITYLGMTAPMAVVALMSWLRHPCPDAAEVRVHRMMPRQTLTMLLLTAAVTGAFWLILGWLGNAALGVSTLSIATSFLAAYLTAMRSPWYALGYAANDGVLIVLWVIAAGSDPSAVPMAVCFAMFLLNDLYGFFSWRRMEKRQRIIPSP